MPFNCGTKAIPLIALAAVASLACVSPAMAKSKSSIQKVEDNLSAAGFVAKPANTPKRISMLSRLPANKFVQRTHLDTIAYVYPDPKNCHCIYVGSQKAYGAYHREMQAQNIADDQRDAAQDYADSQWDWGSWGTWGGGWGRYGFGRGW